MKLLRYGNQGAEKPGALDVNGIIRDLSGIVADITGDNLSDDALAVLGKIDLSTLPEIPADTRLGSCVGNIGKFLCIGLNYSDHAKEAGMPAPEEVLSEENFVEPGRAVI